MIMCPRTALQCGHADTRMTNRTQKLSSNRGAQQLQRCAREREMCRHHTRQKLMACLRPLTLKRFPWPWRIATLGQSICGEDTGRYGDI